MYGNQALVASTSGPFCRLIDILALLLEVLDFVSQKFFLLFTDGFQMQKLRHIYVSGYTYKLNIFKTWYNYAQF